MSATAVASAASELAGGDAAVAQQVDGIPESLFSRVPLAPGTREKRAVEEQLLLRQRMRLSPFYLDRSAALQAPRKRSAAVTAAVAPTSPIPLPSVARGAAVSRSGSGQSVTPASEPNGIDAAVVVMSEALPAARALVPPELLETGAVHHESHGKPPKKRARSSAVAPGEDADLEGLFSSLAQKERQHYAGGEDVDGDGERKGDDDEDKSDAEEGSDVDNGEDDSDGDGGDYDMGQYGSDGDDYDDYGGGDDGDGDDDYGRDDD